MSTYCIAKPLKRYSSCCCLLLSEALLCFFKKNPAFYFLFWILLGSGAYLLSFYLFLFLMVVFQALINYKLQSNKKIYFYTATVLAAFGCIYTAFRDSPCFPIGTEKIGKGIFHIQEKKETTLFGKKSFLYKGTLKNFIDIEGKTYKNIPCTLSRPLHAPLCYADNVALDSIKLIVKDRRSFCIKIDKKKPGVPEGRVNIAQFRYKTKSSLLSHLKNRYQDKKTFSFIAAMAAGYVDNKTLMFEFSKTGIQHLLTISGFHFSLLLIFLATSLKPFLPKKIFVTFLITCLTLYVIYLGPAPSVSRSWIGAILMLIAYALEIPSHPINYLSVAGLIAFLENPLCVTGLGFQLSYLATFGIISYFSLCDTWMQVLLPLRSSKTLFSMNTQQQIFCVFLSLMRTSLALDLAVNLMTLPVIFFYFGSFPLYSFYFNLLIPILLVPSLYLLILGLLCTPITPLETVIHAINNTYTQCILDSVAACPKILETTLTLKNIQPATVVVALIAIFLGMLLIDQKHLTPF